MKTTRNLFFGMMLAGAMALSGCAEKADGQGSGTPEPKMQDTEQTDQSKGGGEVAGLVTFSGVPCQPGARDYKVPPCTGPYPGYEVQVFDAGSGELKASAMTSSDGSYRIRLPRGKYVIYVQNGPSRENREAMDFAIGKGGESVHLDLMVNTGIQ